MSAKGKLFCTLCQNSKRIDKPVNWTSIGIATEISDQTKAKKKLNDKMAKHFSSLFHQEELKMKSLAEKNILPELVSRNIEKSTTSTEKLFKVAYYIGLNNKPFTDFPKLIALLTDLDVDLGNTLHDRKTCTRMIQTIAQTMRKSLVDFINNSKGKLTLIVDESTTVSNVSCLIVYLKTTKNNQPVTFFFVLLPIKNKDADTVFMSILDCLKGHGITEKKLSNDLIALCSDGASTFTGRKSGVGALFVNKYPKIIVWHCLAHRLELSISDVKSSFDQFDEIVSVLKIVYAFYSQSPKNTDEIKKISKDLGTSFKKIGKIFTIRWAASSHATIDAVLKNLEALKQHFQTKSILEKDGTKKQNLKYVLESLRSETFVRNLKIIRLALEETSALSLQLQSKNMTLALGHKSIMNTVKALKEISDNSTDDSNKKAIPEKQFFAELAKSIKQRSMCLVNRKNMSKPEKIAKQQQYFESLSQYSLYDKQFWPKDWSTSYGDNLIRNFAEKFGHSTVKMLSEFKTFKETSVIGNEFQKYVDHAQAYAISSADAERGFSAMNRIVTDDRNNLMIENTSCLMIISTLKMPIDKFNPARYVKIWLRSHQQAECLRNSTKTKNSVKEQDDDQKILFDLF